MRNPRACLLAGGNDLLVTELMEERGDDQSSQEVTVHLCHDYLEMGLPPHETLGPWSTAVGTYSCLLYFS